MMKIFFSMSVTLYLFSCSTTKPSCSNRDFCNVEVVSVYDGDTLKVNLPNNHPIFGEKLSIRLLGIDTAEIRTKNKCEKKKAKKAKAMLSGLISKAKSIDLKDCVRDKYFRLTCTILADGISVNKALIKSGDAFPYDGGTKAKIDWCKP